MRVRVVTFTHAANLAYFRFWSTHAKRAVERLGPEFDTDVKVVDFSLEKRAPLDDISLEASLPFNSEWRPGHGFCRNMNHAISEAQREGVEYLVSTNDDAFISEQFIETGVEYLRGVEEGDVAVVGGVPQKGWWNQSLLDLHIPPPLDWVKPVENLARLDWEFSACVIDLSRLGSLRFDVFFDACLGLCADNDLVVRLLKRGMRAMRHGGMRFFHCRGITQSKFGREPFSPDDPIRRLAVRYFMTKWGVDISATPVLSDLDQLYDTPFGDPDVSLCCDDFDLLS